MKHSPLLAPTFALLLAALVGCGSSSSSSSSGPSVDAPGSASAAILSAETHDALRVRVFYEPDLAPEPAALAFLERRLLERVHKPGGVIVEQASQLAAPTQLVRGEAEVRLLAATLPALPAASEEGRYAIDVLYLAGSSSADEHGHETQLGLSVGARTIAVFAEEVRRSTTPSLGPVELEGALLVHEAGHLLGLVGLGLPLTAPHADLTRPGHCVNSPCVMNARSPFWSGQKIQLGIALTGGGPPDFCPDCQADLRAGGGL